MGYRVNGVVPGLGLSLAFGENRRRAAGRRSLFLVLEPLYPLGRRQAAQLRYCEIAT